MLNKVLEQKLPFLYFSDEETENGGEGDDEKDTPIFYLSNEVIFTNQKMTRFVLIKNKFSQ